MSWARHSSPMRSIHACLRSLTRGLLEGGVVEQDLDAVGSGFLQAANAPYVEQIGQAARGRGIVAGLLIGEKEALAVAVLGGGKAKLGVQQNGGSVAGEHLGHKRLEYFEIVCIGGCSALLGEGLLKRAALVHRRGGDDATCVGDGFESGKLTWGQLRHCCNSPVRILLFRCTSVILHSGGTSFASSQRGLELIRLYPLRPQRCASESR